MEAASLFTTRASRLGIGNRDALVGTISDVNIFITHIQIAGYTGCLKDIGLERKKGGGEETKLIKDRFKNVFRYNTNDNFR